MEKNLKTEEIIFIADQIVESFMKSTTAGFICIDSLRNLNKESRLDVLYTIYNDSRISDYVKHGIEEMMFAYFPGTHREPLTKNLPVNELLQFFNDKRSGKVGVAAKQLKERFLHLDYEDQKLVMEKFLTGSASYRKWCYKTLLKWREPLFDDILIKHWKEYGDNDCLEIIIEQLPSEKIKDIYPLIRNKLNNYKMGKLIQRFGHEDWLKIDKEWIKSTSPHPFYYVRTMSRTNNPISKDECLEIVYALLQSDFSAECIEELWQINERYADMYGNIPPLYYNFQEVRLKMPNDNTINIGDFLSLFAEMGYFDIVASLISWGDSMNQYLEVIALAENFDEKTIRALCKERFTLYINLLRKNMPPKFKRITEFPGFDLRNFRSTVPF